MNSALEHSWNPSPREAVRIQNELRKLVRIEPLTRAPRLVAGSDISFDRDATHAYAVFVVLELPSLRIVERVWAEAPLEFPYIPGLLSFREIPALLLAWRKIRAKPDVIVADGQGIAHPRRLGIASHLGLLINRPTIGCGKSRLTGTHAEVPPEKGGYTPLVDRAGETIGVALRTKARTNPVFASPGHLIDLPGTIDLLMRVTSTYRIPEPTRQAHIYANEVRRAGGDPKGEPFKLVG